MSLLVVATVIAAVVAPAAAAAQVASSGLIAITSEAGEPITSGDNTTPFLLTLPAGAACQGDSADDGYNLMSFMIPSGEDPGTLRYPTARPEGEGRYVLYSKFTSRFSRELTQDAANPGDPGIIGELVPFSFAALDGAEVPSGEYRIGIACALGAETTRYWDAVIEVNRTPQGEPAAYSFSVVSSAAVPSAGGGSIGPLVVLTGGLVLIGVVASFVIRRRRPASLPSESKESS